MRIQLRCWSYKFSRHPTLYNWWITSMVLFYMILLLIYLDDFMQDSIIQIYDITKTLCTLQCSHLRTYFNKNCYDVIIFSANLWQYRTTLYNHQYHMLGDAVIFIAVWLWLCTPESYKERGREIKSGISAHSSGRRTTKKEWNVQNPSRLNSRT